MDEKEKKAIEYLKFKIKEFEARCGTKITTEELEYYRIILKLIARQDKEIDLMAQQIQDDSSDINFEGYFHECAGFTLGEIKQHFEKKAEEK